MGHDRATYVVLGKGIALAPQGGQAVGHPRTLSFLSHLSEVGTFALRDLWIAEHFGPVPKDWREMCVVRLLTGG